MIIAQSAAVSIGFVLDAIFGDPDFKLHPIRLIGYLILFLEKVLVGMYALILNLHSEVWTENTIQC